MSPPKRKAAPLQGDPNISHQHNPATPAPGSQVMVPAAPPDLRISESTVAGTLLQSWPPAEQMPETVRMLVKHAPASFADERLGRMVAVARAIADTGHAVTLERVSAKLAPADGAALFECVVDECPVGIVEVEAKSVWRAYIARRSAEVFQAGTDQLIKHPDKVQAVLANVRALLGDFEADCGLDLLSRLEARKFDFGNPPPTPEPAFYLAGVGICTPGNVTAVSAAVKAGKSAFVGSMLAAAMSQHPEETDCLGLTAANPHGLALVHLDTEQNPFDHHALVGTALRRSKLSEPPPWLRSYCLTGFGHAEARQAVVIAMEQSAESFGGLHSVLIDGVADLVSNVNDPAETSAFVTELHALAIRFACPIIGVIHTNPGADKTRGHLGSQLERKSETNLRLEKANEVTVIWSDKNRGAPIPKATGPRFTYSVNHHMHVSTNTIEATRADTKRQELHDLAEAVLADAKTPCLVWREFIEGIQATGKLTTRTARARFDAMRAAGVLRKNTLGQWKLAENATTP